MMKSINPANLELIAQYDEFTSEQIDQAIETASKTFLSWKKESFASRASHLFKLAQLLEEEKEELSFLMSKEMGKTLKEGRGEVEKCAWVCRYYAENAQEFLRDEVIETEYSKSFVCFEPLGTVLAIMPWNFPFWQFFRVAAPSLMAGNVMLLKHASNVCGCSLKIEELFGKAGFPKGCVQSLLISSSKVANIITHSDVHGVSLTGSTQAGKQVASLSGQSIKKTVLELGGSDPYLILEDADLYLAVEKCVQSRLLNCGQSCIGAKRFIVHSSVKKEFETLFVNSMKKAHYGDPLLEETQLGPMARVDLRDELHLQVSKSIQMGAKCLLGGQIDKSEKGAFYSPTVLSDVSRGMPAYEEELFGPVASIIEVKTLEEAIQVANDTSYGLGGGVFTRSAEKGLEIAKSLINSGACFVNDFVKSDPRLPFGGVKESGFGRELSHYGIKEFTNIKTICVR